MILTGSPQWVRECDACRRFVMGENGEVSTRPALDAAGRMVELPMAAPDDWRPPCGVCPKVRDAAAKAPLDPADDLFAQDWFWDLRQWFRECRAVGDFGDPDPLMRAAAAELDAAERRLAGRPHELTAAVLARLSRR